MGLVLNTNAFINAENGRFDLDTLAQYADYGEAYIAAVTISELLTGVHMAKTTANRGYGDYLWLCSADEQCR